MAPPPLAARLLHIREAIETIESMWRGKTLNDYIADPIRVAATERFLEKVCEAAKHIPDEQKAFHPQVPWLQIRGLGNRLRHGYETIDAEVIWDIVTKDLGPLGKAVTQILARIDEAT
jgi:uncharacterized protein with HEPN domain